MMVHFTTREQFLNDIDGHLAQVKPGDRVEIDKDFVLIHPDDFRYLKACEKVADSLPMDVEDVAGD